jgi:hypothetical protein
LIYDEGLILFNCNETGLAHFPFGFHPYFGYQAPGHPAMMGVHQGPSLNASHLPQSQNAAPMLDPGTEPRGKESILTEVNKEAGECTKYHCLKKVQFDMEISADTL